MISVIMTYYNTPADKFKMAMDSVLQQSYHDVEFVLVNDGGTVSSYIELFTSLWQQQRGNTFQHIVNAENVGHAEAMNIGIQHATGDYYYFMDSDDYIHPQTLSMLLGQLRLCKADVCFGLYVRNMDEVGQNLQRTIVLSKQKALSLLCKWCQPSSLSSPEQNCLNITWNALYKKQLFDDMQFPKGRLHENISTLHKLLWNADKVVVTYFMSYCYRQGGTLASQRYTNHDIITAYQDRLQFVTDVVQDEECIENTKCWYLYALLKTYETIHDEQLLTVIQDITVQSDYLMKYKGSVVNGDSSLH